MSVILEIILPMKSDVGLRDGCPDNTRVLSQVVGHFHGIILNRDVEVGEENDEYKVEHGIERVSRMRKYRGI